MTNRVVSLGFLIGMFAGAGCAVPVDDMGSPASLESETPPPPAAGGTTSGATNLGNGVGGTSGGAGGATGGAGGEAGEAGAAGSPGTGGNGGEPVVTEPNLAASYSFDESSGIQDESGHGNHGTTDGSGITLGVPGKVGNAISFTGGDGHVTIPSSSELDFASASTIEFWVRLSSVNGGSILSRGQGMNEDSVFVKTAQGNVQVRFARAGLGSVTLTSEPNLLGSTWTHVAIVNDGTALSLYIDGTLEKTDVGGYLGAIANQELRIGKSEANDVALNGALDDVKWWTVARTPADICKDAGGSWNAVDGTGSCLLAP